MGVDFTGAQDFQPQTIDEQTVLEHTAKVPRSLLTEMHLSGTPDQVIEQVAEWRAKRPAEVVAVSRTPAT